MEVETVTVAVEDKQQPGAGDANHDGANRQPNPSQNPRRQGEGGQSRPPSASGLVF